MTDYATLKADIEDWSARSDLTANIAGFVRLAEAKINRAIRVPEMETSTTLSLTSGNSYEVALPTGFLGFKSLYNASANNPRMVYVAPNRFHEVNNSPTDSFDEVGSDETVYTIEENRLKIAVSSGATDTVSVPCVYYKRLTALSDSNTTNDVLTNHYDLYLYAGLAVLWKYVDDMEMETKFAASFQKAVDEIEDVSKQKHRAAGPNIRRSPTNRVA